MKLVLVVEPDQRLSALIPADSVPDADEVYLMLDRELVISFSE